MGEILQFRRLNQDANDTVDIDIYTAVDAAIRDLRDIARHCSGAAAREQANACRLMLERAYDAAVQA